MILGEEPNWGRRSNKNASDFDPADKPNQFRYHYKAGKDSTWIQEIENIVSRIDGFENADDVYFTNPLKCGSVNGEFNSAAFDRCINYLPMEIESVDPEVIIAMGKNAHKAASFAVDGFDRQSSPMSYANLCYRGSPPAYGSTPTVIPTLHWSFVGTNVSQLEDCTLERGYKDDYYEKIANTVQENLSSIQ